MVSYGGKLHRFCERRRTAVHRRRAPGREGQPVHLATGAPRPAGHGRGLLQHRYPVRPPRRAPGRAPQCGDRRRRPGPARLGALPGHPYQTAPRKPSGHPPSPGLRGPRGWAAAAPRGALHSRSKHAERGAHRGAGVSVLAQAAKCVGAFAVAAPLRPSSSGAYRRLRCHRRRRGTTQRLRLRRQLPEAPVRPKMSPPTRQCRGARLRCSWCQ